MEKDRRHNPPSEKEPASSEAGRLKDRRKNSLPVPFERRFLDRRSVSAQVPKMEVVPRFGDNYSESAVEGRREWLGKKLNLSLDPFKSTPVDTRLYAKNVENCVGAVQIPLGVAGPLHVNGKFARGSFYIPLATTQGTLVDAYHRGAIVASMAGGVNSVVYRDGVHTTPSFVFSDLHASLRFSTWIREHESEIKVVAEKTTRYAKLTRIAPMFLGRITLVNFFFTTGDASGLNMINIATEAACKMIADQVKPERYFLRSNFEADKKPSYFNFIFGYGKEVLAELTLSKTILRRFMRTTADDMFAFWYQAFVGSVQAGMVGPNAHFANGITAMFMACGQDVAQVVNASSGILTMEVLAGGSLRIYCKFPQLIVATVGGGTTLPYAKKSLEMLGCAGKGNVMKFAEIVAAAALAGEISICGALASGEFAAADLALRKREK